MWPLKPEKVDENLKVESSASSMQTLHIALLKDVPNNLKSEMVPIN
jgi:hypothetical protein